MHLSIFFTLFLTLTFTTAKLSRQHLDSHLTPRSLHPYPAHLLRKRFPPMKKTRLSESPMLVTPDPPDPLQPPPQAPNSITPPPSIANDIAQSSDLQALGPNANDNPSAAAAAAAHPDLTSSPTSSQEGRIQSGRVLRSGRVLPAAPGIMLDRGEFQSPLQPIRIANHRLPANPTTHPRIIQPPEQELDDPTPPARYLRNNRFAQAMAANNMAANNMIPNTPSGGPCTPGRHGMPVANNNAAAGAASFNTHNLLCTSRLEDSEPATLAQNDERRGQRKGLRSGGYFSPPSVNNAASAAAAAGNETGEVDFTPPWKTAKARHDVAQRNLRRNLERVWGRL